MPPRRVGVCRLRREIHIDMRQPQGKNQTRPGCTSGNDDANNSNCKDETDNEDGDVDGDDDDVHEDMI